MQPRLLHQPYAPFAYALSSTRARIILFVDRGAVKTVDIAYGDRYQQPELTRQRKMECVGDDGTFDVFRADVDIESGRLKYIFVISALSSTGPVFYGESGITSNPERVRVFQFAYLCRRDTFVVPEWARTAVCYEIFPERFCNANAELTPEEATDWSATPTQTTMLGGDLPGIISKLDYLNNLGVNLIYLTPIFKAHSNHKYDTEDYHEIDPQFGTKADLRYLVGKAHQMGIRIVLDAVFNHSGAQFAPFQDALKRGKASQYWDWFFINGDFVDVQNVNYETFADKVGTMPKLNVANPKVEEFLLEVATYWIREFGIDGWRLDAANEVDHVFWRKFRQSVKAVRPDALIIGEVWHNSLPWLRGDQFDGVMNYLFRDYGLAFLVDKTLTGPEFAQRLIGLLHLYPTQANLAQFNLLGSHDTERILTRAKGDKRALLRTLVYQFTFPGIPMLYYGDEVGMEGKTDPDCRRGMLWDAALQDARLQTAVKELIHLKRMHKALQTDELRIVRATRATVEYKRLAHNGDAVHVAFNVGSRRVPLSHHGHILFRTRPDALRDGGLAPGASVIWEV